MSVSPVVPVEQLVPELLETSLGANQTLNEIRFGPGEDRECYRHQRRSIREPVDLPHVNKGRFSSS